MSKQQEDGGWSFKLDSRSSNPGTEESRTAATAMALLPFLGAGYTHQDGPYTDVVGKGLYFLQRKAVVTPNGANLQDGTMYGQGLATIALCEAYAMTGDREVFLRAGMNDYLSKPVQMDGIRQVIARVLGSGIRS